MTDMTAEPLEEELECFGNVGKTQLETELARLEAGEVPNHIEKYRQKYCISQQGVDPMLHLLALGRVSRFDAHQAIIKALVAEIMARIDDAQKTRNVNVIVQLLQETLCYLLVEELRPIPVRLLEVYDTNASDYDPWGVIIGWGCTRDEEEKPYHALPLKLKIEVWVLEPDAFDDEVKTIVDSVPPCEPPRYEQDTHMTDYDATCLSEEHTKLVQTLCTYVTAGGRKFACFEKIIKGLSLSCDDFEKSDGERIAVANLLLDFLSSEMFVKTSAGSRVFDMEETGRNYVHAAGLLVQFAKDVAGGDALMKADDLQKLRTLKHFVESPELMRVLVLLLHSSLSRNVLVTKLVWALEAFSATRYGHGADPSKLGRILKHQSSFAVLELAFLMDSAVNAKSILRRNRDGDEKDAISGLFDGFFPLFVEEIRADQEFLSDPSQLVAIPPSEEFAAHVSGARERKIFCCYVDAMRTGVAHTGVNAPGVRACLSRYRLVLDDIYGACGAGLGQDPSARSGSPWDEQDGMKCWDVIAFISEDGIEI